MIDFSFSLRVKFFNNWFDYDLNMQLGHSLVARPPLSPTHSGTGSVSHESPQAELLLLIRFNRLCSVIYEST